MKLISVDERDKARPWEDDPCTLSTKVCLDASTFCQLKCPSCPTAGGDIADNIGRGHLSFDNFKRFLREHPWITAIELSNWGEIFLNPELVAILEHAYENAVVLTAKNGANLNSASDKVLEALVKYKLRVLTCSIDGARQISYGTYRVNGKFNRVIENIKTINRYKQQYGYDLPQLRWQFVAFGHNEHEISQARKLADELNMKFKLKLSWDDLYAESFSPIKDRKLIAQETGLGVADRREFKTKFGKNYIHRSCLQLWEQPRINHDGRVLGCSVNYWADFGNAFEQGLRACLTGEKMNYAKQMLAGKAKARPDIPCTNCKIYKEMSQDQRWLRMA